jgi:hypothetical protein
MMEFLPPTTITTQAAGPEASVFVVEGEKDADRLTALGLVASTNPGGAGKWREEYSTSLAGRKVIIIPDNDRPGQKHAETVARSLAGKATETHIVRLPGLRDGQDVSDWLDQGGTVEELLAMAAAPDPTSEDDSLADEAELLEALKSAVADRKRSQASTIVSLAQDSGARFFHTLEQQGYAAVIVDSHRTTIPLKGKAADLWLRRLYHGYSGGDAPGGQAVADALNTLRGIAIFDGEEHPVYVRAAAHASDVYIDLGDPLWRAVRVDGRGWEIVNTPPIYFRRTRGMLPLPIPVQGGSLQALRSFLNISDSDDFNLMVTCLINWLFPTGPYAILVFTGEQGTGKSIIARIMRDLIDPNAASARSAPHDERDLVISANNSWLLSFDNVSTIPDWLSDALCRLATGGGYATRELYSDTDEIIMDAQRPMLLNGIENITTRGDLADRAIMISPPKIAPADRQAEDDLWANFQQARPAVFGALLDGLATALHNLPDVRLRQLPRMADFAKRGAAMAPAVGWKVNEFLDAYRRNRASASTTILESSLIAEYVLRLALPWEGTASQLFAAISSMTDEKTHRLRAWPKAPNGLSGQLRRLAPALRTVGIEVVFDRAGETSRRRLITISEVEKDQ